jgi:Ca2+-binding EF-hand superfamily protein
MEIGMNPKTITAAALATAFALPALAQQAGQSTQPKETHAATAGGFAAMDRNGDGYLSRDEARDATWNSRFSELDKDNDGRISQSEFDALQGPATGAAGATGDKPGRKQ